MAETTSDSADTAPGKPPLSDSAFMWGEIRSQAVRITSLEADRVEMRADVKEIKGHLTRQDADVSQVKEDVADVKAGVHALTQQRADEIAEHRKTRQNVGSGVIVAVVGVVVAQAWAAFERTHTLGALTPYGVGLLVVLGALWWLYHDH